MKQPTNQQIWVLGVLGVLTLFSCSNEPPSTDPDEVAGTGSAGGNPLALQFEADTQSRYEQLQWETPELHIELLRILPTGADGDCQVEEATEITYSGDIFFSGLDEIVLEPPFPCRIDLLPEHDGVPLFTVEAIVEETTTVRFEIRFEWGLGLHFDQLARLAETNDIYLTIETDRLLDGIDLFEIARGSDSVIIPDRSHFGDPEMAFRVEMNFLSATRLYLDPTPGDGLLSQEDRTPSNIIGSILTLSPSFPFGEGDGFGSLAGWL